MSWPCWKNILRNRPLSRKSTALFIITGVDNVHEIINSVIRKDYGNYYISGMALLDGANTGAYGNPEITEVNIGVRNNPGILVSGHDLKDLEQLLEQLRLLA